MQTRVFYYWVIINYKDFIFDGDKYKITKSQLQKLYDLIVELLKTKSNDMAQQNLPPYPSSEINQEYWDDIYITKQLLKERLDTLNDNQSLYYIGSMPDTVVS